MGLTSVLSVEDPGTGGIRKIRKESRKASQKWNLDGWRKTEGRGYEISTTYPIHLFINKYLMSICSGPGTVLGNKHARVPVFMKHTSKWGGAEQK